MDPVHSRVITHVDGAMIARVPLSGTSDLTVPPPEVQDPKLITPYKIPL